MFFSSLFVVPIAVLLAVVLIVASLVILDNVGKANGAAHITAKDGQRQNA